MTAHDSPAARPALASSPRRAALAVAVDAVLVIVFAALGQGQHSTAAGPLHLLATASPFLAALLLMSALTRADRTWSRVWPHGVVVWLGTVALGMALRVVWGLGGAPASFVVVTLGVLGVLLIGRRAVSRALARRGPGA